MDAQSLGSLARSSPRVRKVPVKVYTDADLVAARGRANFGEFDEPLETTETAVSELPPLDLYGTGGAEGVASEAGAPSGPSEEEARAQRLADLKKQVEVENKVIAVVQRAMQEASTELNDLTSFTFGGRRAYLMKIMEDGQRELAKSQQVIADVEEKARRDGFVVSR